MRGSGSENRPCSPTGPWGSSRCPSSMTNRSGPRRSARGIHSHGARDLASLGRETGASARAGARRLLRPPRRQPTWRGRSCSSPSSGASPPLAGTGRRGSFLLVVFGGGALSAIELLGKLNFGIAVLAFCAATLAQPPARRRNVPLFAGATLTVLAAGWVLAGQRVSTHPRLRSPTASRCSPATPNRWAAKPRPSAGSFPRRSGGVVLSDRGWGAAELGPPPARRVGASRWSPSSPTSRSSRASSGRASGPPTSSSSRLAPESRSPRA